MIFSGTALKVSVQETQSPLIIITLFFRTFSIFEYSKHNLVTSENEFELEKVDHVVLLASYFPLDTIRANLNVLDIRYGPTT